MNNLNKELNEIEQEKHRILVNYRLNELQQKKRRILANYKRERHLELLKRSEELHDESEEARELSDYSILLEEQLNWETREYLLQLQEKFLKNEISSLEFCDIFHKRDVLNSEISGMLESNFILLSPHKKSLDFSKLTFEIMNACYGYEFSYDPDHQSLEIQEIEDKKFRNFVQTIYLQIQNLLKE